MKVTAIPAYERERLKALKEYYILDSLPDSDYDDITEMASTICDVPIALISFIDANRQWFKSHRGLSHATEVARDDSFATHAINFPDEVLVINDLSKDERFSNDPFVTGSPHVLFYAGVPLISPDGHVLGTLSVLDIKVNSLSDKQLKTLQALGRQVVCRLELRKKNRLLAQKQAELNLVQTDLEQIAFLASHDLRTPLNNVLSLVDLLKSEYAATLGNDGREYIGYITDAANVASGMIGGILLFSRAAKMAVKKENINVRQFFSDIKPALAIPANTTVTFHGEDKSIYTAPEIIKLVLIHLIKNAMQYNDKPHNEVDVIFHEEKNTYSFEVRDTGEGIDSSDKEMAFTLFKRLKNRDKSTENMGVGLAIVKRLVEKLGGDITVSSKPGQGSSFTCTFPR